MTFQLERFRIEGLHGSRTIDVPIENNRLILVGENGTGKSTIANFIYFFLTRQWWRMWQYEFDSISVTVNSETYNITKTEITPPHEALYELSSSPHVSRRLLRELHNIMVHKLDQEEPNWESLTEFIRETGVPFSALRKLIERENDLFSSKLREYSENLKFELGRIQVLYLPTYRRIEKELELILQRGYWDEPRYRRPPSLGESIISDDPDETDFIELVEFGMRDVEHTIRKTMSNLKEDLTNSLNNLTGTYLREVVLGTYEKADQSGLDEINVDTVEAILSRIGEELLSDHDKQDIIERIRKDIHLQSDVVAHFLIRLNELYKKQQKNEEHVKEFVRVCNLYLRGKRIVYDYSKYRINIYQTQDLDNSSQTTDKVIRSRDLSSGEKQIISLFSHVYLSGKAGYFVIIDEPELSLSVPWQRKFLPDILKTQRCEGLIAVTHSPFIFDNELSSYVYSLEDFVEPNRVIS